MNAKLMAGLRDSNVRESGTTPLAMHKAVISAGKPSRKELDWVICEI